MRLKSALRRGVAAAVIAGIVVSSGIPAYADRWDIVKGDITVEAGETKGTNKVTQGGTTKDDTDTVITGESKEHTVTIDTSRGDADVTFDDLKINVSGKAEVDGSGKAEVDVSDKTEGDGSGKTEVDGSGDSPVRESNAAVTVQGGHNATIELDGKKVTLAEALGRRQFGKVYILLGINEIGAYTAADWAAQYKSLLDLVREKQPDAVIFIQSIFHTTQKKSDSSYFKNEVINERNAAIAQLADGKTIFYLDLNPLFDDENGALRADYSGDGVHVRAPYYVQWRDELYRFGVVK